MSTRSTSRKPIQNANGGRPVIAVNGEYRPPKEGNPMPALSWFNSGYYDTVAAGGGLPMLVPPAADDADVKAYLGMADGLLLTGSQFDLDPVRLGMDRHPATRPMPLRREDFDRRLAEAAIAQRMPILAVGGGMQLLNVLLGGTLHQHLPEDLPRALHHRDTVEDTLRHLLEPVEGTRVASIYGHGEIRVNSHHHMAVESVAPEFLASAHTPDGVIEAIEAKDEDWFCVGVQWHPENESSSALDMQVFDAFLESCRTAVPAVIPMTRGLRKAA